MSNAEAIAAQLEPYAVDLEKDKIYAWCACGRSKKQPFCDGSHKETGLTPVRFTAEKDGTHWLCGCKQTGSSPMCDGTHKKLAV
jgi:CDGSH-type Zn-finger protein